MSKFVANNIGITVGSTDLSNHAHQATLQDSANQVDFTAFGGNGYMEFGQGLKDATVTVDFYSDFAASSVHATLYPLYTSGTTFSLSIVPDSTVGVSATNPRGSMLCRLYDYSPVSAQVGAAATFTATFKNAGSGIIWGTV